MVPPTNFLIEGLFVVVFEGSTHSNIQITKGVNIHNNIQKIISNKFSKKYFATSKFFYNNKIKIIPKKLIISSSTINQLN